MPQSEHLCAWGPRTRCVLFPARTLLPLPSGVPMSSQDGQEVPVRQPWLQDPGAHARAGARHRQTDAQSQG